MSGRRMSRYQPRQRLLRIVVGTRTVDVCKSCRKYYTPLIVDSSPRRLVSHAASNSREGHDIRQDNSPTHGARVQLCRDLQSAPVVVALSGCNFSASKSREMHHAPLSPPFLPPFAPPPDCRSFRPSLRHCPGVSVMTSQQSHTSWVVYHLLTKLT